MRHPPARPTPPGAAAGGDRTATRRAFAQQGRCTIRRAVGRAKKSRPCMREGCPACARACVQACASAGVDRPLQDEAQQRDRRARNEREVTAARGRGDGVGMRRGGSAELDRGGCERLSARAHCTGCGWLSRRASADATAVGGAPHDADRRRRSRRRAVEPQGSGKPGEGGAVAAVAAAARPRVATQGCARVALSGASRARQAGGEESLAWLGSCSQGKLSGELVARRALRVEQCARRDVCE